MGCCFLVAYPNTIVDQHSDTHFDVIKSDSVNSSVKAISYIHVNDYSERIVTHNQNTFTSEFLKKRSDAATKSNISKYQTSIKRIKYLQYSRNLHLKYLSTDIIFPFHTFW